jgi:hypothetical protein
MKTIITNSGLTLLLASCAGIFLAGCASMDTHADTKSLLSSAGFRVRTPETAKQRELYAGLPNNKIERGQTKGKTFYVFKDEKAGVTYVGGEAEHRRYQKLCADKHEAQAQEEDFNPSLATSWNNQWGVRRNL